MAPHPSPLSPTRRSFDSKRLAQPAGALTGPARAHLGSNAGLGQTRALVKPGPWSNPGPGQTRAFAGRSRVRPCARRMPPSAPAAPVFPPPAYLPAFPRPRPVLLGRFRPPRPQHTSTFHADPHLPSPLPRRTALSGPGAWGLDCGCPGGAGGAGPGARLLQQHL